MTSRHSAQTTDQLAEEYISGEAYQARLTTTSKPPRRTLTFRVPTIASVIIVIVLCGLSFVAGSAYQKGHTKASSSGGAVGSSSLSGGGLARRGFRRGVIGQVTAVSSTSITVNNERTGGSSTYSITSSTTIDDSGQTVSASDIKTGDTVLIMSSDGSTASRISVNPSFSGFGGSGSNAGGTSAEPDAASPNAQSN